MRQSERSVSPVIGVILMVAVTVIMAAIIASFVLGLGSGQYSEAEFSYSLDKEAGTLEIVYIGDQPIPAEDLYITGDDLEWGGSWWGENDSNGNVTFGDSVEVEVGESFELDIVVRSDGEEVQVGGCSVGSWASTCTP